MPVGAELLERHGGDFQMQVDAVEQGAADLTEVALDNAAGAAAFPRRIAEEPARTSVQITTDPNMNPACAMRARSVRCRTLLASET